MSKNIRWKIITILVVLLVFSATGVYPILASRYNLPIPGWLKARQLQLGLDLKGGVHLVLKVHTEEAIRTFTTTTSEQLRESLRTAGVTVSSIGLAAHNSFRVEGVPADRDAEFRRIADEQVSASYDRGAASGGAYTFTMKPNIEADMREQAVDQALQTIDRRVNALGVSEPNISEYGQAEDQILVQIPRVTAVARAKDLIGKTAAA